MGSLLNGFSSMMMVPNEDGKDDAEIISTQTHKHTTMQRQDLVLMADVNDGVFKAIPMNERLIAVLIIVRMGEPSRTLSGRGIQYCTKNECK